MKFLFFTSYLFSLIIINKAWKYSEENKWSHDIETCNGDRQSPIDIDKSRVRFSTHLISFELPGFDTIPHGAHWILLNNGKTLQILLSGKYIVREGGLGAEFKTHSMVFHWGTEDSNGSEHWFNGTQYPMELQIYHFNTKYGSFDEALNYPDGIAAFSFFIKVIENENTIFHQIINKLSSVAYHGQQVTLRPVPILSILPINLNNYYRYDGSLTQPPCSQIVAWTIFQEKIAISKHQFKEFTNKITFSSIPTSNTSTRVVMRNNFRTLQPLKDRIIYSSLEEDATFWTAPLSPISITLALLIGFIILFLVLGKQPIDLHDGVCGGGEISNVYEGEEENVDAHLD